MVVFDMASEEFTSLLKENQELKQKYENAVADYETTMAEKIKLKKQLKHKAKMYSYACKFAEGMEKEAVTSKVSQIKFIKYLEEKINFYKNRENYKVMDILGAYDLNKIELELFKEILQKYKEIIGVSDEKK